MSEKQGFLALIKQKFGDGDYPGDEHGGSRGDTGRGLPDGSSNRFLFATGIECSYPTIRGKDGKTIRRDQLEETYHYQHWKQDLQLVRDLGLRALRYGLPYYKTHLGPGRYDWSFADDAMHEMQRLQIEPILDLLHFGVPDWLGNFQNPELPLHFAAYAKAVAERYPWVRFYTPVNEIYVTAKHSARDGEWNECLKDDRSFVTAMKHLAAASILANQAIAEKKPNCVIVQSESAEYLHEMRAAPSRETTLTNKLRFLSLDLLYAHPPDGDVCTFLYDNGMTREEYEWFMLGEPPGYQVMGNDYYGRNEKLLLPDGTIETAEDVLGWYNLTREYYRRYRKPVMHTETNTFDAAQAPAWLWKQWVNIVRMREAGVPVLGFTWYSLVDQVDWETSLAVMNGTVNECGLYDLQRRERPVAKAYRSLLEEFGHIGIAPGGEMFVFNDKPKTLRTHI